MICSFNFLIFLAVCLNISTVINIKILTNSNQQTQSYNFTSHISAFLSVVLITDMLEICIQTSYDQNVQLMYGTPLRRVWRYQRVIRRSKSKDRQYNGEKRKDKRTNNCLQNNTQEIKSEGVLKLWKGKPFLLHMRPPLWYSCYKTWW